MNEFKRMQQLAGINEIRVNQPVRNKIEVEPYTDTNGTTYYYAKLPIDILNFRGGEDNFIGRKINNGILKGMLIYPEDYDFEFENGVEWNILKNYLDKIRVKYTTENIDGEECIFIPDNYIQITNKLNEIRVNQPEEKELKAEDIEWDDNDVWIDDNVQDDEGEDFGIGTIYGKRSNKTYEADFSVPYNTDGPDYDKIEIYNIKRVY
jgi:hypothetical protein